MQGTFVVIEPSASALVVVWQQIESEEARELRIRYVNQQQTTAKNRVK